MCSPEQPSVESCSGQMAARVSFPSIPAQELMLAAKYALPKRPEYARQLQSTSIGGLGQPGMPVL